MISFTLAPMIPVINWLVRNAALRFICIVPIDVVILIVIMIFCHHPHYSITITTTFMYSPSSPLLQVCEGRSQREASRGESVIVILSEVLMVGIYYYALSKFVKKIWHRQVF
jgi:hypothetical protein